MSVSARIRRLSRLVPFPALLWAAACGGGDNKSPTGPDGEPGPEPGQQHRVGFELVRLGLVGLPADTQLEDCVETRFYSGGIQIDPKTGEWQMNLMVHDDSGDWEFQDRGGSEGDDTTVIFDSELDGGSYDGTVNDDGTEVKIMYDWCVNGVPDVQLVFDR
jgi:hypothetical protein